MSEVQGGPFAQWMKDFCHWKVTVKPRPTTIEQMKEASRLSGINIHRRALAWLLSRKDVDAYLCLLSADGLERAKHRMKTDLEFYAELHRLGAEMALKAEDHRSIAAYTVPALDRILPRRQEAVKHEPIVVIQVTQAQADKLEREPIPSEMIVEAEIITEEET